MGWRVSPRHVGLVVAAFAIVFAAGVLPAAAQSSPRTFRDCADCPEMVVVPAGSFTMGSPESEAGRFSREGPQRSITISHAFAVGRFEVTRTQYDAFSAATRRTAAGDCITLNPERGVAPDTNATWRNPNFSQGPNHPIICVSWDDAQAYVAWLNSRTSGGYRLLSEAEWEYVARAGSNSPYPWGSDANAGCLFMNGDDLSLIEAFPRAQTLACNDGALNTAAVGSYQANGFGVSDMIGNVNEWVADCFEQSLEFVPSDGSAHILGNCSERGIRGGAFVNDLGEQYLRSAFRAGFSPVQRATIFGFRVAKTL